MGALRPDGFLARCVRADVEKTALQTLELWVFEALVFDFIDERFDLLYVGNSIVCDSFEFRRSGLRARGPFIDGRPVRRLSAEVDDLAKSARRTAREDRSRTPGEREDRAACCVSGRGLPSRWRAQKLPETDPNSPSAAPGRGYRRAQ